jgi:predicted membrane protein
MRHDRTRRSPASQVVLGGLVIGMGVLFLLDNLGIVDFDRALSFWPIVFIIAGIVKLLDTNARNGYVVGLLLIGAGATLILNRLGFFYVSWNTLWPVLLIALGAMVMYRATLGRATMGRKDGVTLDKDEAASDSVVDVTAILGGLERRVTSSNFRGGEVTAIMGGCDLDMRASSIEGEAVLNVFAAFGGITIKCPPDWTVILHGTPILGGFDERTATPPNDAKRLIVQGYAIMGGVEVRN